MFPVLPVFAGNKNPAQMEFRSKMYALWISILTNFLEVNTF